MVSIIGLRNQAVTDGVDNVMLKRFSSLCIVSVALLTSGCASVSGALSYQEVKPWERGALAEDGMQPVLDSMDISVDEHIYFSREASTGGGSVRGGGCGCN
ncbi:MAG: DUF4266 domain-containing protein [Granulosicoccus sp.]